MMLTLTLYLLVLINSEQVLEIGETETKLECAAGMGYMNRASEDLGAELVSRMLINDDGSFSMNMAVPTEDGPPEIITISCSPAII
jgi:hypothetical protein